MTTHATVAAPSFAVMPDLSRPNIGSALIGRKRQGLAYAALGTIAAAVLAALVLSPFAGTENTHPTPEMLAAWEQMMRDG